MGTTFNGNGDSWDWKVKIKSRRFRWEGRLARRALWFGDSSWQPKGNEIEVGGTCCLKLQQSSPWQGLHLVPQRKEHNLWTQSWIPTYGGKERFQGQSNNQQLDLQPVPWPVHSTELCTWGWQVQDLRWARKLRLAVLLSFQMIGATKVLLSSNSIA